MIDWKTTEFENKNGSKIIIDGSTLKDAYNIVKDWAESENKCIAYSELMAKLKERNHPKIYRGSIGHIVGHISDQVCVVTNPSVYPSSIVVHKGTRDTGSGFWTLEEGTSPPRNIASADRKQELIKYQLAVFKRKW